MLMEGKCVSRDTVSREVAVNRVGWWWKPWFFKHVQATLARGLPREELIPLRQYLMRHD